MRVKKPILGNRIITGKEVMKSTRMLEKHAFDNFDDDDFDDDDYDPDMFNDDDSYDPDMFKGRKAKGKKPTLTGLAQLDILIDNTGQAADQTVELFNYLRSCVNVYNPLIDATKKPSTPDVAALTVIASPAMTAFDNQSIFFDQNGNLILRGATDVSQCKISCTQMPYRTLFESSGRNPFIIKNIRATVSIDAQIDQPILHFRNGIWGGYSENSISVRSGFSSDQFQSKIIELPNINARIDPERGFKIKVLANQSLNLSIFISKYSRLSNNI